MKKYFILCVLSALFFLCSCTTQNYVIINTEYSYDNTENKEDHFKEIVPILLNLKTGDTWELRPESEDVEAGYKWIKQVKE